MIECVRADVLGACDDAALDAQCLGVRANLEGDSSLQSEVRDYPAAIPEDPFAVAVVDEDHGVVLLGELGALQELNLRSRHPRRPRSARAPAQRGPRACARRTQRTVKRMKTQRGTSARQARVVTPSAGVILVTRSETIGVPSLRTSSPVVRARRSAASIGPKSRPVKATSPHRARAKRQ
mgnify:CR=1 FL=1